MGPSVAKFCLLAHLLLLDAHATKKEAVRFDDDAVDAVQRLRDRLSNMGESASRKYGLVLTAGPKDEAYAQLTTPIWRSYCEEHRIGFLLQEEALNADLPFEWTRPRLLLEVFVHTQWSYVLVVDSATLPANFARSWRYMIDAYMRFKRYGNDRVKKRMIFSPWECDEEYDSPHDGCYSPMLSGSIFWAKKPETLQLVHSWYHKRRAWDVPTDSTGALRAFAKVKDRHYDEIFFKDIASDVGRKTSKFIATFSWDKDYGWNVRDQIFDYIVKHKELARVANEAAKRSEL